MSIFSYSKVNKTKYSTFNLSHDVKLSCEMGQLVPFFCQEVLPGDKWKLTSECLVKMAPMLAPIMHRVDVRVEYFYVPNRLLTPAWEKVMYPKPNQSVSVQIPHVTMQSLVTMADANDIYSWHQRFDGTEGSRDVGVVDPCSLADYLGVSKPASESANLKINILPLLAYQRIYNDYYRDENLMPDLADMQDGDPVYAQMFKDGKNNLFDLDGDITQYVNEDDPSYEEALNTIAEVFQLRNRCWEKDYFTSCLPWRQAGAPAVAPLQFDNSGITNITRADDSVFGSSSYAASVKGDGTKNASLGYNGSSFVKYNVDNSSNLGLSIADLQTASWLQRFLENIALGGHRMVEQILTHFGVRVPDYKLQRAEYLGGNRSPLMIDSIYQTSASTENSPLANPSGNGKSVGVNKAVTRTFEEHGFLIGLVSVVPRSTYSQGISKMWTRMDRLDWPWPEFAFLGEEEVLKRELIVTGVDAYDNSIFGYQQRYADHKYIQSSVHGDFADTLDFWHLGREFSNASNVFLNQSFVTCNPSSRIWSVPSATNHIWMMIHNSVLANRPLPQVSNSSLA